MNNNTLSTSTTINEDYMLFPYNDHNYSSQTILPFSPSSSLTEILIPSTSNTSNNLLDHHHNQFSKPSPFSQFEFGRDFALFASFLPQNNGQGDNQTIPYDNHHPPSLLVPLNKIIGDQPLDPLETITHIEDSQRSSAPQDPKMKKIKKPNRTDRHSKIKTAKGTRDRRMRLSLDVARELFGLQDMLGFDKASKTVEWLLTQAKPEILKVAKTLPHHLGFSSGDESQTRSKSTTSDIGELASMGTVDDSNFDTAGNKVDGGSMKGKTTKRLQKRTPILKKLSKDQRAQARERAKDRTKEKMMMKRISRVEAHDHGHEIIKNCKSGVNWISFDETTTHCEKEIEERCKNGRFEDCNVFLMNKKDHISEESYDIINKLNSSFPLMLSHHRNPGAVSSIEHRFTDLHDFLGKPRDLVYNYQNMF